MLRKATDTDYNFDGNEVHVKLEIYFDGIDQTPLTVTSDTFLIDVELLEETGADDSWPLGVVSSNELSFSLYSDDGMFNPVNPTSVYHNKIKTGVVVKPYIRPGNLETENIAWDQLGEFKVTNWVASLTGVIANVTAQDMLREINKAEKIKLPVVKDVSFKNFYEALFDYYKVPHSVDNYFSTKYLAYAFIDETNIGTLQDSTIASMGICHINRLGIAEVKPVHASGPTRITISDMDQIISADSDQSSLNTYDGASLFYSSPQVSSNTALLTIRNLKVKPGIQVHDKFTLSKQLMMLVTNVSVEAEQRVSVSNFHASPDDIVLTTINNHERELEVSVTVTGSTLEHMEQTLGDTDIDGNVLELRNNYIQNSTSALEFKNTLDAYVGSKMPAIDLVVKGNPLIKVGDKVRAVSTLHKFDFVGIVVRTTLRYDGGLSGTLRLVAANILGGA